MLPRSPQAYLVWALVVLLLAVRQDFWNWANPHLVFGFIPVGLLYHGCLSVAAAVVWYLATLYCWPDPFTDTVLADSPQPAAEPREGTDG